MIKNIDISFNIFEDENSKKEREISFSLRGIPNEVYYSYMNIYRKIVYTENVVESLNEIEDKIPNYIEKMDKLFSYMYIGEEKLFGIELSKYSFFEAFKDRFNLGLIQIDTAFSQCLFHLYGEKKK